MENDTIFRDKSMERIASPDQLGDYIRLSNPGTWFILTAVAILLAGAVVFGMFGLIEHTVPGVGISKGGRMLCLVKKEYGESFREEMSVRIDGTLFPARLRSRQPATVLDTTDPYALTLGALEPGEWVYEIEVEGSFADGDYPAELITERVSPFSFLAGGR